MGKVQKAGEHQQSGSLRRAWRRYVADWRRRPLWRPGFRPKWWDFAASLGLVLVLAPFVLWAFWRGKSFEAHVLSAEAFLLGLPPALILLAVLWKSTGWSSRLLNRAMLQLTVILFLLIPLNIGGAIVEDASLRRTFRAGESVAAALESYRERHGRYPESLAEAASALGGPLPQPTIDREFGYSADEKGFSLSFGGGLFRWWIYQSQTGKWLMDD